MNQENVLGQRLLVIMQLLFDSDPILRIRALQRVCSEHAMFAENDVGVLNAILIKRLDEETHPKVIRWLAYTLASICAGRVAENAISEKMKRISDDDVMEWLIASKEKLVISSEEKKGIVPVELHSRDDLLTGVIKSWAYNNVDQRSSEILVRALEHPDAKIRRWAVLSIGNKQKILPGVKEAIKRCFDDDDYLVREWSVYAFRKFTTERDFEVYASGLEKEPHVRVREWIVKSLPNTQSRDVPVLLLHELDNIKYTNDTLYIESIVTALGQYVDHRYVRDRLIAIIQESNDDVILLATASSLRSLLKKDERIVIALHEAYNKAQSESVRKQIGTEILNSLDPIEKKRISDIIKDQGKKFVLKVTLSPEPDSVLEQLLLQEGSDYSNAEKAQVYQFRHESGESRKSILASIPPTTDLDYNVKEQSWYAPSFPKATVVDRANCESIKQLIDVVIITAVKVELNAVVNLLRPLPRRRLIVKAFLGHETYYLGRFGSYAVAVTKCRKGATGVGSSTLVTNDAIDIWAPKAVIMIGVAFGKDPNEQRIGDVLVASEIISYEQQRVGMEIIHRGTSPPSDTTLLDRFENDLNWKFYLPDGSLSNIHSGPILSGEKLVDDPDFKALLFDRFPHAIGGEMEGSGFCAAADRKRIPWILVKSICDWGDGRKSKKHQPLASAVAASITHHVLGQRTALDSLT